MSPLNARLFSLLKFFISGLFLMTFLICRLEAAPLKKITVMTAWLPQAQFAGFYAAKDKGIYEKYGLEVEILHGGPNRSPYDWLISGKTDVAILWLAFALEKRSQGAPLVNIAQMVQRSALMLVAKKESGIRGPQDIADKKVGLWGDLYQIQPKAFLEKFGVQARIIPQGYSINLFLQGGVDVASAMWYNEYHSILNAGYNPDELVRFFFSDYDLNFPEDGLYALEPKRLEDPDRYKAFAQASLEGWQYAFNHEKEAVEMTIRRMKEHHIPANRVHQKWMLARMKDVILPPHLLKAGVLSEKDYQRTSDVMRKNGLIENTPVFQEFYRPGEAPSEK